MVKEPENGRNIDSTLDPPCNRLETVVGSEQHRRMQVSSFSSFFFSLFSYLLSFEIKLRLKIPTPEMWYRWLYIAEPNPGSQQLPICSVYLRIAQNWSSNRNPCIFLIIMQIKVRNLMKMRCKPYKNIYMNAMHQQDILSCHSQDREFLSKPHLTLIEKREGKSQ